MWTDLYTQCERFISAIDINICRLTNFDSMQGGGVVLMLTVVCM